jgi:hypothetical protein
VLKAQGERQDVTPPEGRAEAKPERWVSVVADISFLPEAGAQRSEATIIKAAGAAMFTVTAGFALLYPRRSHEGPDPHRISSLCSLLLSRR